MKKTLLLYLLAISFTTFSCKPDHKETVKQKKVSQKISEPKTAEKSNEENKNQDEGLFLYGELAPIELKDSKSTDVFKKYGIEFSGNCYSCDLAVFKINKKNLDLVSICDKNDFKRFKEFSYERSGNTFKIRTAETTFIFTKVENEPIYQLIIEGKKPDLKNKRIVEFYTPENLIEKFEEHNCGDFQG